VKTASQTKRPAAQVMTEIRWHGRGGQGAVTAAKMVAEVALGQQKHFQAFPEYGPERSGAPIVAFTRISDEPIQIFSGVEHPQIVAVLDPTLLSIIDVTKGALDDAVVLINSDLPPARLREKYKMQGRRLYTVAATKIAVETIGRSIPNTPMVGALVRITGLFPLESVVEFMRAEFGKKFPPKVVEGNVSALTRAYEEVQGE
jgi:pyruvate ferredoxin oxidoreductase gamma subunit